MVKDSKNDKLNKLTYPALPMFSDLLSNFTTMVITRKVMVLTRKALLMTKTMPRDKTDHKRPLPPSEWGVERRHCPFLSPLTHYNSTIALHFSLPELLLQGTVAQWPVHYINSSQLQCTGGGREWAEKRDRHRSATHMP